MANYHAPQEVDTDKLVETLKRFGVTSIRMQRDVFNPELYFRLLSLSSFGDLARMPQFKAADEDKRTGQLLTYPVLMAHDVVGYDEVLVGEDQEVHIEYARRIVRKYNRVFKENLTVPRANVVGGKVRDLRQTDAKMSKSSPEGCLFLDDDPDTIRRKLRRATPDENGRANLEFLYKQFVGPTPPDGNQALKDELAEGIIKATS